MKAEFVLVKKVLLLLTAALTFSISAPSMAAQGSQSSHTGINVPLEVLSALRTPGIRHRFTGYESYAITFKTDPKTLAAMLPDKLTLADNSDIAVLTMNRFNVDVVRSVQQEVVADGDYYELILTIPALYKSAEGDVSSKIYMAQLYLGSIQPESSVRPILAGQLFAGYPKREAMFRIKHFGREKASVHVEKFGATIVDMKLKRGKQLPSPGSQMHEGSFVLFKAIPSAGRTGWDVLQLTQIVSSKSDIDASTKDIKQWAVDANFNGDLVLDTGRTLPILNVESASFSVVKGFGSGSLGVLHDYLVQQKPPNQKVSTGMTPTQKSE